MRYLEAISALKAGKERKFILPGPEIYLKDQFVRICKSIKPSLIVYYPDNAKEALEVLSSDSMFEEEKAYALIDFDKMKPEKFSRLIRETKDILILCLTEKADLKSKSLTEVIACAKPVPCEKMKEYGEDYPTWVSSVITSSGYTMEEGVAREIYLKVGPDMFSLSSELDKLFIVKGDDKYITKVDVDRFVSKTARSTAYELLDDLLNRNVKSALVKYSCSSEDPGDLVRFLGIHMEKLYRVLLLKDQKFDADQISEIVGIHRFLLKTRYMPKALAMGKSMIADKIDQLCQLEVSLRSFKGSKNMLFERFIYSFAPIN
jgi:DNA polymerase III subunit delta